MLGKGGAVGEVSQTKPSKYGTEKWIVDSLAILHVTTSHDSLRDVRSSKRRLGLVLTVL